jgi:hypothetical protein
MEISRFKCFKDISNQPGLALSQGGCWLWLFWFGRRRETDISRFKVTSQQLYGWHHCSMAVNICQLLPLQRVRTRETETSRFKSTSNQPGLASLHLGEDVKRTSPVFK